MTVLLRGNLGFPTDIIYCGSHEDSTSHLVKVGYFLLVVEATGLIPQLCGKGQNPIIGYRNTHVWEPVNELPPG